MLPTQVELTGDTIDLKGKVLFDTAKAIIKPESYPLLQEVVQIMQDHPEIERVRVEGHTDSRGSDSYNMNLSKERAASVMAFLIDRGIDSARLESEGYGETRPLDPREIPEAWEQNRRVVFFVVQWAPGRGPNP